MRKIVIVDHFNFLRTILIARVQFVVNQKTLAGKGSQCFIV
jgi:hypothetical protein